MFFLTTMLIALVLLVMLYRATRVTIENCLAQDAVIKQLQDQKALDEERLQVEALQFIFGYEDELREEDMSVYAVKRSIKPLPCKGKIISEQKIYNL